MVCIRKRLMFAFIFASLFILMFSVRVDAAVVPENYTGWYEEPNSIGGYDRYYYVGGKVMKGFFSVGSNKYYSDEYNGCVKTGMLYIGGKVYDADINTGVLTTGWKDIWDKNVFKTYKYHFGSDCSADVGLKKIGTKQYFFDKTGKMLFDTVVEKVGNDYKYSENWESYHGIISGSYKASAVYYFDKNGQMITGWKEALCGHTGTGTWFYFDNNGKLVEGWKKIKNKWYYFDIYKRQFDEATYYYGMATGLTIRSSAKLDAEPYDSVRLGWDLRKYKWIYLFNKDGSLSSGWTKGKKILELSKGKVQSTQYDVLKYEIDSSAWYYFDINKGMLRNTWKKIGGKWYNFDENGCMWTGWLYDKKTYYFNASGVMQTGWKKISGDWYYFKSSGEMKKGWLKFRGKWYYLRTNGVMETESYRDGHGNVYKFNSSGVCLNP